MKILRFAQRADRLRQPAPVALAEEAAAQPVRVDPRLAGQHAQEQLLLRHFEAEEADGHVGLGADVLRHVQHQAGLAHRRPRRDDDQVAGCRPEVISSRSVKPVGTPVTSSLRECSFSIVSRLPCARSRSETKPSRTLSSAIAKIALLGLVEDQVGFVLGLVGGRENLVGREDQVPERRLLLDDPRVVLDVGRARHAVDERRDVGRAADFVELARAPELFLQRDQIDRVAALDELDHLVEDAAVRVAEEVAASR